MVRVKSYIRKGKRVKGYNRKARKRGKKIIVGKTVKFKVLRDENGVYRGLRRIKK